MAKTVHPRPFLLAPRPTWNERITQAREAKAMTKKRLAAAVGVTPSSVSDWESATIKSIDALHMLNVSQQLDVSAQWIMTGIVTQADIGKVDPAFLSSSERRLLEGFYGLTPGQQEDAITRIEGIRTQNSKHFAELSRISDRLTTAILPQSELFQDTP